jgi:hypothetical protein
MASTPYSHGACAVNVLEEEEDKESTREMQCAWNVQHVLASE